MSTGDNTFDPQAAGAVIDREWRSAIQLLEGLGDGEWQLPTRCAGWSVRDLALHNVWGVTMEVDALRRSARGDSDPAEGYTMPTHSPPTEILATLRLAVTDLVDGVAALSPADADRSCPMPYGEVPLPAVLAVFMFEAVLHANDHADAVGRSAPLGPEVTPVIASVLAAFLPSMAMASTAERPDGATFTVVGETVRLDGGWSGSALVMGPAVADPSFAVSGDDSSALLFVTGRLDVDDPRLTVRGDRELARRFKELVPGP